MAWASGPGLLWVRYDEHGAHVRYEALTAVMVLPTLALEVMSAALLAEIALARLVAERTVRTLLLFMAVMAVGAVIVVVA